MYKNKALNLCQLSLIDCEVVRTVNDIRLGWVSSLKRVLYTLQELNYIQISFHNIAHVAFQVLLKLIFNLQIKTSKVHGIRDATFNCRATSKEN